MISRKLRTVTTQQLQQDFFLHIEQHLEARHEPGFYQFHQHLSDVPIPDVVQRALNDLGKGDPVELLWLYASPGHVTNTHTDCKWKDNLPERWHLPVQTDTTIVTEDGVMVSMWEGAWYGPVRYWLPHSVRHLDTVTRIHLVADFNVG